MGDRADREYKGDSQWRHKDTNPTKTEFKSHRLESEQAAGLTNQAAGLNAKLKQLLPDAVYERYGDEEKIIMSRTHDALQHRRNSETLNKAGYRKENQTIGKQGDTKIYTVSVSPVVFLRICKRIGIDPSTINVIPPERLVELQALPGMPIPEKADETGGPSL